MTNPSAGPPIQSHEPRHAAGSSAPLRGGVFIDLLTPLTDWMAHIQGMLYRIIRNQEGEMATLADVQGAIDNLKSETESGLQTLIDKVNSGGSVTGDDLQNLVDQLNGLHDEVASTVASVSAPPSPAPTPDQPPAPATGA